MKTALQRWLWLVTVLPGSTVFAAETEHGLPQSAVGIEHWGGFITNSMVVSWVVAIALLLFARLATRNMKNATDSATNLTEELTLEYNKLRQGNITKELLEIAGGQLGND